jgi:hypothetical protein
MIGSDDQGDGLQAVGDGFDKAIFPEKSFVVLSQFKRPTDLLCQAIFVGAWRSIGAPILFNILILFTNHKTIKKFWCLLRPASLMFS